MNRFLYIIISLLFAVAVNAQKDSLQLRDKYLEDQLYLDISYNGLRKQPSNVRSSSFSYGISIGYIRDIPLTRSGKFAFGLGLGYGYDSFTHGLKVTENASEYTYEITSSVDNKLRIHNLEMPIQFRIRTSDSNTYSFWRVYSGVKLSYNLTNRFTYQDNDVAIPVTDVNVYNKFQAGLTLSAGYGTFNFYLYYGLTPIFKSSAILNQSSIDTKIFKLGLSFYIL
ncbi:Outer membrane protein beta-barrel domain-containing protein [Tenacibaculum sp. MAR_2009_124]|uniref:porin family protein n=1 Tax=Tenacibaculum sp. MAR_2009_124 TaxID=1250059 RepID=UPI0008969088|nr:porin family protein [Tenacibaculum sp. MAR_2009_124]SED19591.1 Outer membrane protein beta-barrel domain-containing protein [Tenacibaculum sp. MAR_2009_124]